MDCILDCETPPNVPLSAKYKRSFAFISMKDRCPVIITKIIDYLSRDKEGIVNTYGEGVREEIKRVTGDLSQLKNQLQTGKPLECFIDSDPDVDQWNSDIKEKNKNGAASFYDCDWLFAECFLYRKIREIFSTKNWMKNDDPFYKQKLTVLQDSLPAISDVVKTLLDNGYLNSSHSMSSSEIKLILTTLIKNALWANQVDLSLSAGSTNVDHHVLKELDNWDERILVDDTSKIYSILLSDSAKTINYVLDNCGYELLSDLCLADFLVTRCKVKKIIFRTKRIPWYVSDVTSKDFHRTISSMIQFDHSCQIIGERWKQYLENGIWELCSDHFWCLGLSFTEMPSVEHSLYEQLKRSQFIIFKGDLNYRKLVQDTNWDPATPFALSLGNFHPAPLLALRTCKADTIAGLDPGVAEKTALKSPKWLVTGEYALIQCDIPLDYT